MCVRSCAQGGTRRRKLRRTSASCRSALRPAGKRRRQLLGKQKARAACGKSGVSAACYWHVAAGDAQRGRLCTGNAAFPAGPASPGACSVYSWWKQGCWNPWQAATGLARTEIWPMLSSHSGQQRLLQCSWAVLGDASRQCSAWCSVCHLSDHAHGTAAIVAMVCSGHAKHLASVPACVPACQELADGLLRRMGLLEPTWEEFYGEDGEPKPFEDFFAKDEEEDIDIYLSDMVRGPLR
jgi:hypothetical protein